jgi:hypothetical protein
MPKVLLYSDADCLIKKLDTPSMQSGGLSGAGVRFGLALIVKSQNLNQNPISNIYHRPNIINNLIFSSLEKVVNYCEKKKLKYFLDQQYFDDQKFKSVTKQIINRK